MRRHSGHVPVMKTMRAGILALAAAMASCGGESPLTPGSGGEAYDVLIAAEDSSAGSMLRDELETSVMGLPQAESGFTVYSTRDMDMGPAVRYARSIVRVTTDAARGTRTRIRYEKNVYARPQIIVYISAASATALRKDMPALGSQLRKLLGLFELKAETERLKARRNMKAEHSVDSIMGCGIMIPAGMRVARSGKDFIWLSDNSTRGTTGICIYSYPAAGLDADCYTGKRDSVMRLNIPGERPGMHMVTETRTPVLQRLITAGGRRILECRGLWSMAGDAMGGPFVSHSEYDSARRRVVVAEGFVYAPESAKRNKIKQLEAVIYTMSLKNNKKD